MLWICQCRIQTVCAHTQLNTLSHPLKHALTPTYTRTHMRAHTHTRTRIHLFFFLTHALWPDYRFFLSLSLSSQFKSTIIVLKNLGYLSILSLVIFELRHNEVNLTIKSAFLFPPIYFLVKQTMMTRRLKNTDNSFSRSSHIFFLF